MDLKQALAEVAPDALLAPPRILRRVIKEDRGLRGLGLAVPHRKTYTIAAEALAKLVSPDELGLPPDASLSPTVLLLAHARQHDEETLPSEQELLKYWRLLFHARIHAELEARAAAGQLTPARARRHFSRLGPVAYAEIRSVLKREHLLLPPADELHLFIEFAAVYLELRYFARQLLPLYFPALDEPSQVDALLAEELDPERIYAATRLPGACDPAGLPTAEPHPVPPEDELGWVAAVPSQAAARASPRLQRRTERLSRKAQRASSLGNQVRATILYMRAARQGAHLERPSPEACAELRKLIARLQVALDLSVEEAQAWYEALFPLLPRVGQWFWSRESRLLYDLQKVCLNHERGVYRVALLEWLFSLGRKPLKRLLAGQREVLTSKHLHTALRRLTALRLGAAQRGRLEGLLQSALAQAEQRLRERFRQPLLQALQEVGLQPDCVPEQVALHKIVDELLDRVAEHGFLTMLDLRDAISRSNLKLPDLAELPELWHGDRILKADRRLADVLEGIYRRAEVYLRWPQRLSSVVFGTRVGRMLVRYVGIPFGGAFMLFKFAAHIALEAKGWLGHAVTEADHLSANRWVMLGTFCLGAFLLNVLYLEGFRRGCLDLLRLAWRLLRLICYEAPRWLLQRPYVQRLLRHRAVRLAARYLLKPSLFVVLTWAAFPELLAGRWSAVISGLAIFTAVNLTQISHLGRDVEEFVTDLVVRFWTQFRIRILGILVEEVVEFFHRVLDGLDRFLYTVDEWLRFRSGQSLLVLLGKSLLTVPWFVATYVVRFCVTLLIEPQINPVKHFPVVTVSHKILISLAPMLQPVFDSSLGPLVGKAWANALLGALLFVTPGIFGYLVWELKENWRLYEANRPAALRPVRVGHHGETVVQLLRPGFHSGTLPKAFHRLRRALRKQSPASPGRKARKARARVEAVTRAVQHFAERELIGLLSLPGVWDGPSIEVAGVQAGTNRLQIVLALPEASPENLVVTLADISGVLTAQVSQAGWLLRLPPATAEVFSAALAGFYKMCGVELIWEQLDGAIDLEQHACLIDSRLLVWPAASPENVAYYNLADAPLLPPRNAEGELLSGHPTLERDEILFSHKPLWWKRWVDTWRQDRPDQRSVRRLAESTRLFGLPQGPPSSSSTPVGKWP
ncbi:MAG: hypothetical protein K6T86_12920 [Pirellulales bacterium]|nr:hypothetical protein [Pirellulales bacterium]